MKLVLLAIACLWSTASSAGGLDIVPFLLSDRTVGVVVRNTSAHRAHLRQIVVRNDRGAGAPACRFAFDTAQSIWPRDQATLLLGLDLDTLAHCLPPEWVDTFGLIDVAEISLRKRGCLSCDYRLGVWAWNIAVPFDIGYDASVGYRRVHEHRKAYVHFWRVR